MDKNDNGNSVVNMDCFCGGKHCEGNLYIQPDTLVDDEKCFMVSASDSSGNDDANLWLSVKQMRQLIKELSIMVVESEEA